MASVKMPHRRLRQERRRSLPWLPLFLMLMFAIVTSILVIRIHQGGHDGLQPMQHVRIKTTVVNSPAYKRTVREVELTIGETSTDDDGHQNQTDSSFFDCNRRESNCRYFRPRDFYQHYFSSVVRSRSDNSTIITDDDDQENASLYDSKQYDEWSRDIGLENSNLPALTSLYWDWTVHGDGDGSSSTSNGTSLTQATVASISSLKHQIEDAIRQHIQLPHNLTYIHVHKCGGTSIQSDLRGRARRIRNDVLRIHVENEQQPRLFEVSMHSDVQMYKHSFGGGSSQKKQILDEKRLQHIHAIGNIQQLSSNNTRDDGSIKSTSIQHPIFTVVRDPVQRFLSAVQQVMHYNTDFREKCLYEPPPASSWILWGTKAKVRARGEEAEALARRQTIQCAIHDVQETNYRGDVHLLPIASHFRLLDGAYRNDIAVSVFYMDDLEEVLQHLSGSRSTDKTEDNGTSSSTIKVIHARDRSDEEYATSPTLAKLSIDDINEEMMQQVCTLYDVDVALLHWLGFAEEVVARCNGL